MRYHGFACKKHKDKVKCKVIYRVKTIIIRREKMSFDQYAPSGSKVLGGTIGGALIGFAVAGPGGALAGGVIGLFIGSSSNSLNKML